jgi:extracellular factor (EF) 3-hydroxypalmitic acid methyl ester biosynthesis protein
MAASSSQAAERERSLEPPALPAALELHGRRVRATLRPSSRLALAVTLHGEVPPDGAEVTAVEVGLPGGPQRLGPARFSAGGTPGTGRLYFREHLYDCRALFGEGRVVDLRALFDSVPAVLAQKDRIRPEFREHVAGVAYDLSVYKRFFDEQDRLLAAEPPDAADAAGAALLATEGRRFLAHLDARVAELERVVNAYSREEHERHGFYLRRQLWPYLATSECLCRTNLKPSGYPGDAELMVMLYENAYVGASTFGQLMHKFPVETRAADAVRARRALVPRLAAQARARRRTGERFRMLSIACGPAYELFDVLATPEDLAAVECVLLDQDPAALELARGVVRRVEAARGASATVRYVQDSVRTMLRSRDLEARLGPCEFVYSMGLFDYLTAPVARAVLARAFGLLAPGGLMVVGNFHELSPTRVYMDYWADWPLTYRTEEAFLALSDGLPCAERAIVYDETRCQMFLVLTRGPGGA